MDATVTQLIERQGKRHLRYQSAQLATRLAQSDNEDLQRNLLFNLRDAFIRLLAADSILQLANDNLTYYDKVIGVNRERYKAGDIAKIDLQRVELQRAQFESDYPERTNQSKAGEAGFAGFDERENLE